MNLTGLHDTIGRIRSLPEADRMTAARVLLPALEDIPESVTDETAARLWIQLGRYATGRPLRVTPLTRDAARAAVTAALAVDNPMTAVIETTRALADHDARRPALHAAKVAAVLDAKRAGVNARQLAAAAGISPQTLADWQA